MKNCKDNEGFTLSHEIIQLTLCEFYITIINSTDKLHIDDFNDKLSDFVCLLNTFCFVFNAFDLSFYKIH